MKGHSFHSNGFAKGKFLGLPLKQQHKKCAEILRAVYEYSLQQMPIEPLVDRYHEMLEWMGLDKLPSGDIKTIADRYHEHLESAVQHLKEHNLLPSLRHGDRETAEESWPYVLYLDRLRSAYNVGSILRTVEGLGFGSVYFHDQTPFIDHRQVQQSSMGAYEWTSCKKIESLDDLPRPIVAMDPSSDAISVYDFIFPEHFTLVLGNEEYGCSDEILKAADFLIEVPMRGRKNSLNVANAFAIAAGEIYRQRHIKEDSHE
ncbi:MAG: TrmH family RNA methyltransferase [Chlamydiales bacterium]|nr:TrmH family RNA methyltransferase [Chlamydiia bacterium]MCP5507612.1 TrmH family RNA methyltransferase [Chlamydiales bacterium]